MKEHEMEQELKKGDGLAWEQNRIIYMDRQIYIPNNRKIKEWILQENYDPVDVGHSGQQQMMELVKRNYWWPGLKEDIKNMFKDASNANKIKSNIRRNLENYIYSTYHRDYDKRLVSMLLDHCPNQMKWMLLW